ncbi:MAG: hypothetical protein ACQEUZ_02770 [Pseudomonadota bacterium]
MALLADRPCRLNPRRCIAARRAAAAETIILPHAGRVPLATLLAPDILVKVLERQQGRDGTLHDNEGPAPRPVAHVSLTGEPHPTIPVARG